ncbi:hypothetical protein PI125_g22712 [Phytophthora idaei]|nr:hypothetical protein PI125_g22712 [Phytophthora idaei]
MGGPVVKPKVSERQNRGRAVARTSQERRQDVGSILQLTDDEIITEQEENRLVQRLVVSGAHRGMKVTTQTGWW